VHRPLFVAEADFRATKVFTRVKKGMLALYGTDLHVVDVLGLEAADVASGLADVTSHVLRWVNYVDVSVADELAHAPGKHKQNQHCGGRQLALAGQKSNQLSVLAHFPDSVSSHTMNCSGLLLHCHYRTYTLHAIVHASTCCGLLGVLPSTSRIC